MRKAFTLIELLVVIAIIAILAAILFPVFAQAKSAAKKSVDLSNVKQVGTAFFLYVTDSDDVTPTVSKSPVQGGIDGTGYVTNWYVAVQPYAKSWALFLNPVRTDAFSANSTADAKANGHAADPYRCYDNINPTHTCLGYGYNDGWVSDSGYGLLQTQSKDANGFTLRPGKSLSSITAPADTVAFGDSRDNPGMSVAMDNALSRYPDFTSSKSLFFGGSFNFAFSDGHAKNMRMNSGEYAGFGQVLVPASQKDALKWCSDADVTPVNWEGGIANGYPVQTATEKCSDAVAEFYAPNTFVTLNP